MKHIVGIDPGKNGAIVHLTDGQVAHALVMPTIGKKLDIHELARVLALFCSEDTHVFVEAVHAIYGSAAGATFVFGEVFGAIKGVLATLNQPFTLVQPKKWQAIAYQGIPEIRKPSVKITKGKRAGQTVKGQRDTKAMSLLAAKRLFPNVNLTATERNTKPHDGIVDALLIAAYGYRELFIGTADLKI